MASPAVRMDRDDVAAMSFQERISARRAMVTNPPSSQSARGLQSASSNEPPFIQPLRRSAHDEALGHGTARALQLEQMPHGRL
jgi:hypothetical protein